MKPHTLHIDKNQAHKDKVRVRGIFYHEPAPNTAAALAAAAVDKRYNL